MSGGCLGVDVPLDRILPVVRDAFFKKPEARVSWENNTQKGGRAGVVALYPGLLVMAPGVVTVPEAAYDADGENELTRLHGKGRDYSVLPLDRIDRVELQKVGSTYLSRVGDQADQTVFTFEGECLQFLVVCGSKSWAFTIPDADLRHLVAAFDALLGRRFSVPADFALPADPFADLALDVASAAEGDGDRDGGRPRAPGRPLRSAVIGPILLILGVSSIVGAGLVHLFDLATLLFPYLPERLAGSPGIPASLATCGLGAAVLGSKLWRSDARRVLLRDRRPPILFLRSFNLDGRPIAASELSPDAARFIMFFLCLAAAEGLGAIPYLIDDGNIYLSAGLGVLFSALVAVAFAIPYAGRWARGRLRPSYELALEPVLRRWGPYVAVGRPGERFIPRGAHRIYVGDDWRDVVSDLARRSQLVVLQISPTPGTWWELVRAVELVDPSRLLLLVSAVTTTRQSYEEFRLRLEDACGIRLPNHLGGAAFFHFGEDWSPRPIRLVKRPLWLWPFVDCIVDLRRSLQPVLDRLHPAGKTEAPTTRGGS